MIGEIGSDTVLARSHRSVSQSAQPCFIRSPSENIPSFRLQSKPSQTKRLQRKQQQPISLQDIQKKSRQSQTVRSITGIRARPAKVYKRDMRSVSLPVRSKEEIYMEIAGHFAAISRLNQELAAVEKQIEEVEEEGEEEEENELEFM